MRQNAVNYEVHPLCGSRESHVRETLVWDDTGDYGRKCEFLHSVHVCKGQLRRPNEPSYCLPDSLIAIHELMHAEELRIRLEDNIRNIGGGKVEIYRDVKEIMTVTKSIILADAIAKKLSRRSM